MHRPRRHSVPLSRRLLSETASLHSVPAAVKRRRLLLQEAVAMFSALLHVVLPGRLLPEAVPMLPVVDQCGEPPLSARPRQGHLADGLAAAGNRRSVPVTTTGAAESLE